MPLSYRSICCFLCQFLILLVFPSASIYATNEQPNQQEKSHYLPPLEAWHGASEELIVGNDNPWQTPAEKSDLTDTPDYQQTFEYLDKLVASDHRLNKIALGKSPQGREIWMIVANQQGIKNAAELLQQGKPSLLVQAGIHSGEIDGKDAGLMLLRDIVHGGQGHLIEKVNLLFVPILSVDAHERRSPFNRVNQRGPTQMGWRTNSQNLNLNRDYSKLDALELQHLIKTINQWQPDLYFDVHVTDGEDYQYDITYGFNGEHGDSPNISRWLQRVFKPSIDAALSTQGHLAGPLTFGIDPLDFKQGLYGWTASPRYSNGYGDTRHLATVLIENHSLKPYKQRVLGTYVLLKQSLLLLAKQANTLRKATELDKSRRPASQVVAWDLDQDNPETMDYAGIEYRKTKDPLLNLDYIEWLGKPTTYHELPIYWQRQPKVEVKVAKNYWLPPQYHTVIERLTLHGIEFEILQQEKTVKAVQLTAGEFKFSENPFEGRMQPTATFTEQTQTLLLPKGSLKICSDQALGRLVVALLDPRAPDSFFSWGFFNSIFQQTEYIESYAMIPMIQSMLKNDPSLKKEFDTKKQRDEEFAKDSTAQMRWFYQRSGYYDQSHLKYPVLLEYD